MPSVGTQTTWSWLQEKQEPAKKEEHLWPGDAALSRGESTPEGEGSRLTVGKDEEEEDDRPDQAPDHSNGDEPQPQTEGSLGGDEDCNSPWESRVKDISLDGAKLVGASACLPQELIRQLDGIQFPSDSEPSSDEEDGDNVAGERGPADQLELTLPDLSSPQLPWPAILQYLRESESLATQYFSLENMVEVAERRPREGAMPTAREDKKGASTEGGGGGDVRAIGLLLPQGGATCEFCGQITPKCNLLSHTGENTNEGSPFCCAEHQEFCLLAAAYMRQMVHKKLHQRPRKIAINPSKRRTFKKTVEERALAMMRRKKQWEELKQKRLRQLQSSSFYSLTKQTKTIQFSLLSPTTVQTRWMVRPESSSQGSSTHLWGRRRRRDREWERGNERGEVQRTRGQLNLEKGGLLPPELAERLQQYAPTPGKLDIRGYSSGQPFVTLLPDRTGQCHYPSGRLALVVFAPYPGVLSYLVFEDGVDPQMLACLDELGRVCCYNPNGSMRLLLTTTQGTLYDDRGHVKTKWSWRSHSHSPLFQPISLILNKHIQLRCSAQDNIALTLSVPPQFIKFTIGCKISKDMPKDLKLPKENKDHYLQGVLKESQATIRHLLQAIQYTRKVSQLQSAYTPQSRLPKRTSNHDNSRRRTRSTGALALHGQQRTSSLRPLV